MGVSAAASVRVGHALGEGRPLKAKHAGWTSILLGVTFMGCAGIILYVFDDAIIGFFINDPSVIDIAKKILILAALFQVADGMQVVGTGALRGLSDTKSAMYANLIGHWFIGLPIGYYLCFYAAQSIVGLWTGLTFGLIVVAVMVLYWWIRKSQLLVETPLAVN